MKRVETEIQIDAPPEAVWSVLADFNRMDWNPMFASVTGKIATGERLKVVLRKPRITLRTRITVMDRPRVLEWRGHAGIPGLVGGLHAFELAPANGGTRLLHHETFSGLLMPLLAPTLPITKRMFEAYNRALKTEVERRN